MTRREKVALSIAIVLLVGGVVDIPHFGNLWFYEWSLSFLAFACFCGMGHR